MLAMRSTSYRSAVSRRVTIRWQALLTRSFPILTRCVLPCILVLLPLVRPAAAQTQITTGVIQGSVADTTGASLPGVTVEARNLDTNFARTLVTEADGRFVVLQLPPGNYRVTFTLAGFATMVQENI